MASQKWDSRDTTVGLWDYFYLVRIKEIDTRTIEDIQERGVIVSGIEEHDRTLTTRLTTRWYNIDQMFEFYRRRIPFFLVNVGDAKTIYEAISDHLYAWIHALTHSINIQAPPLEDLTGLDEFANTVYSHARWILTKENVESVMGNKIMQTMPLNIMNIFQPAANGGKTIEGTTQSESVYGRSAAPERLSLKDHFRQSLSTWRQE